MSFLFDKNFWKFGYEYIKLTKEDLINIFYMSFIFSFLYSLFFLRFNYVSNIFSDFIFRFVFLFLILIGFYFFVKLFSLKEGMGVDIYLTKFNRYYIYPWSKVENDFMKGGILTLFLSVLIFLFSFGLIIFSGVFNFKFRKIPKFFVGTKKFFEEDFFEGISEYRKSLSFFYAFIYFFFLFFLIKIFSIIFNFNFVNSYTVMLLYFVLVLLLPIPGSIGFELYSRNIYLWFGVVSIILPSILILFLLKSLIITIIFSIILFIIVFFILFWNYFLK